MAFVSREVRIGNIGDRVTAQTNSFRMQFPTKRVHHYDTIRPCWTTREMKIGMKKGNEIVMRVQSTYSHIFTQRGAFDGKKNLFSPVKYFPTQTFRVNWEKEEVPEDRKPREVEVVMTWVNEIDFSILQRYIGSQLKDDTQVSMILNMLNVFVQAAPKQKAGVLSNAKSVYVPDRKITFAGGRNSLGPLELWYGFFQSVRPAFDHIVVNVDVTMGVVLPRKPLPDICAEFLKTRNLRDVTSLAANSEQFRRLRQFIKGVKVIVNLPRHKHKPARAITDLVPNVGQERFSDKNGDEITVAEHFRRVHNIPIQPSTLGIRIKTSLFPITCCLTDDQLYKNRATPEIVQEILRYVPENPQKRSQAIKEAFRHFEYSNSHFLSNTGIRVDETPENVPGRKLPSPAIGFGRQARRELNQRPGVWDILRQTFVEPAKITAWVVVVLARVDDSALDYFIRELVKAMQLLGISVPPPSGVERKSPQADVVHELMFIASRYQQLSMMLVILPDPAEMQYRQVKRFGDITQGIVTQCIRWSSNLQRNVNAGKINQYQNNLILKINPKLGGTNFVVRSQLFEKLKSKPMMIVGADVSHPGPGSQLPSIASVVGSWDNAASKYTASIRVQSSRVEMIQEFEAMFEEVLGNFYNRWQVLPAFHIVFRDGVSEGEFINVHDHEIGAMQNVFLKAYGADKSKHPKVVYIVVGKRHHVRFFPSRGSEDPKGNFNFPAGLVVDSGIVHPRFCDFFLQSQPGLKGTSIPSHYTVLRNELGMDMNEMQLLAYGLCHAYSRSTRSVKIPAPVYYADLVCRRAKFHFDEDLSMTSSVGGNEDSESILNYYKQHFTQVNERLKRSMYFV